MARYLQQVYCPQGFPLPVGSQAPTDQSLACAPMVRSFEPVAARSPVSVTIEQRTAREAVRNCCRTEFASQHVLRSSWSLLLEERRRFLLSCGPAVGGHACAQWASLPRFDCVVCAAPLSPRRRGQTHSAVLPSRVLW